MITIIGIITLVIASIIEINKQGYKGPERPLRGM